MYVSSKLNFEVICENALDASREDIWVCVKNIETSKNIVVASIYRHSTSETTSFVQALHNRIAILGISNYNAYLLEDIKLNISRAIICCTKLS